MDYRLPHRIPHIIRLDGKTFHTYVKKVKCEKPFDENLHNAMCQAAIALCEQITNARFAYIQSDEISILIHPKNTLSQPWMGNRLQKIASVSASIATAHFNFWMKNHIEHEGTLAFFDSRAFILPQHEVHNYFWWRQSDAIRNSVSMLARHHFSHKKLYKKSRTDMLDMLNEIGVEHSKLPFWSQCGSGIKRDGEE